MEFNKYVRAVGLACLGALGSFQVNAFVGGVTTYAGSPETTGTVERAFTSAATTPELNQTYQRTMRKAQSAAIAAKAVKGILRTVSGLGLLLTVVELGRDLNAIMTTNPDGTLKFEKTDPSICSVAPCYEYQIDDSANSSITTAWLKSPVAAGEAFATQWNSTNSCNQNYPRSKFTYLSNNTVSVTFSTETITPGTCVLTAGSNAVRPVGSRQVAPVSNPPRFTVGDAELEDKLKAWPALPRLIGELDEKGQPIPWPAEEIEDMPSPLVISPRVTVNPDGSTVTERTTLRPYRGPDGKTVNWERTTAVTNTTAPNPSGATTSTTTTTTSNSGPSDSKKDDRPECEKSPDTLGCSKLDTPDGTIPKSDKNVSYAAEVMFGSGSCPADRSVNQLLTGRSIVLSYAQTCDSLARYVQPLIIAIALFMAYLIILPGNRE